MDANEYKRLREQVETEYRRKLDAIDLVWQMATESSPPAAMPKQPRSEEVNGSKAGVGGRDVAKGEIIDAIREILPSLRSEFTFRTISQVLRERNPAVAAKLKKTS